MLALFRVALAVGAVPLVLSLARTQPPPPPTFSDAPLARFRRAGRGGPVMVPVTIEGKTYSFIVDTGATHTLYDVALAPLLGAPVGRSSATTVDGQADIYLFAAPKGLVGKLPLPRSSPARAVDLTHLRAVSQLNFRGILGMDFLADYVVELDYQRGELILRRSLARPPCPPIVLLCREGLPWVKVDLPNGRREPFQIDTGFIDNNSGALCADVFGELVKEGEVVPSGTGAYALGGGGPLLQTTGRLESLALGPFVERRLNFVSPSRFNVLGLAFWSRYAVTFDFPSGLLYLQKRPEIVRNPSGLHLRRIAGKTVIGRVDAGSPAARSGARARDVLIEMDGAPVGDCPLPIIRRLLAEKGKAVPIRLRRGKKTVATTLWLKAGDTETATGPLSR
jgi:hypothetical protein